MDGLFALEKIASLKPDVVTLDMEMPRMGGLQTLRKIVHEHHVPVVVVSAHTKTGTETTLEALDAGALDVVVKPEGVASVEGGESSLAGVLIDKVRMASKVDLKGFVERGWLRGRPPVPTARIAPSVIAIGVSTGGPKALSHFLPTLSENLTMPVLIVQHMPAGFTRALADRLACISPLSVSEATDRARIRGGQVWLAPGNRHMEVTTDADGYAIRLTNDPAVNGMRPSVDVLFHSVAAVCKSNTVAVLMTGMGEDGAAGMESVRKANGHTVVQDADSSVIYGMPGAALKREVVDRVVSLREMGPYLNWLSARVRLNAGVN